MSLIISPATLAKLLSKHEVVRDEIEQCFMNRSHTYVLDVREDHQTDPPTEWFIAETDKQRKLKVAFVATDGNIYIKTAYEPNPQEETYYSSHSKQDDELY